MDLLTSLGLGMVLFASTDVDDLFVLIAFMADPRFRTRHVAAGQFLGILALLVASFAISLVSLVLDPAYVGLLGGLPILMGIKGLLDLRRGDDDDDDDIRAPERSNGAASQVLSVFSVTIANGGDNLSAYTPLFATQSVIHTLAVAIAMLVMTGGWLAAAHWLVNHRTIGAPIRRYGERVVPFVLLALGVYILHRAGSFALLSWWHPG